MAYKLSFTVKNILIVDDNGNKITTHFISCDHMPVKGYFVQDVDSQQNLELFLKGLNIMLTMDGKRGAFLRTFAAYMLITLEDFNNGKAAEQKYCQFIAFVCDLANHKNLKDWEGVYHKDFPKFVDNLCWNYYLDDDWVMFKNTGYVLFEHYRTDKAEA